MIQKMCSISMFGRAVLALVAVLAVQALLQSQIVKADGLIIADRPVVVEPMHPDRRIRPRPTWMPLHVKNHHVSVEREGREE